MYKLTDAVVCAAIITWAGCYIYDKIKPRILRHKAK